MPATGGSESWAYISKQNHQTAFHLSHCNLGSIFHSSYHDPFPKKSRLLIITRSAARCPHNNLVSLIYSTVMARWFHSSFVRLYPLKLKDVFLLFPQKLWLAFTKSLDTPFSQNLRFVAPHELRVDFPSPQELRFAIQFSDNWHTTLEVFGMLTILSPWSLHMSWNSCVFSKTCSLLAWVLIKVLWRRILVRPCLGICQDPLS